MVYLPVNQSLRFQRPKLNSESEVPEPAASPSQGPARQENREVLAKGTCRLTLKPVPGAHQRKPGPRLRSSALEARLNDLSSFAQCNSKWRCPLRPIIRQQTLQQTLMLLGPPLKTRMASGYQGLKPSEHPIEASEGARGEPMRTGAFWNLLGGRAPKHRHWNPRFTLH
jgi:hypothetical protein